MSQGFTHHQRVLYLISKYALTALLVVLISEIAKRSTVLGALMASIPLISVLAMVWIYVETKDTARLSAFSLDVLWLVIPSLALFALFPLLVRGGLSFWWSLAAGLAATTAAYALMLWLMSSLRGG
ncbi:MAG: DUF3147 family protein [Pseudomonadales bacterium]